MIVHFEDTLGEIGRSFVHPGDACFFCGEKLDGFPMVMWNGTDNRQIWLHGHCATKLGERLFLEGLDADMTRNIAERNNGK